MGHKNYMSSGFSSPLKQRNIIAFVGNGFDIQAMQDHEAAVDTRYESFYHFLKLRSFNPDNLVFKRMDNLREAGKENWSDVEAVVSQLLADNRGIATHLQTDLFALQAQFAEFLELAVPTSLLVKLGEDSMSRRLAVKSLEGLLADLEPTDYRRLSFPQRCGNFDIYNFVFFNFNYTPLFDNFIYLDQQQFDPMPFRTVDRNFQFRGNPRSVTSARVRALDTFSSYVMTETIHPHGIQGVPRSLLFGIDSPDGTVTNQDEVLRLSKPFWAQNQKRYGHLFEDTELFVIFGCSLGESDRWWWKQVAQSLGVARTYVDSNETFIPEVIIYWYNSSSSTVSADDVRTRFIDAANMMHREEELKPFIHVVLFDSSVERTWLSTSKASEETHN